jgi:hypothetical protein
VLYGVVVVFIFLNVMAAGCEETEDKSHDPNSGLSK